jgi:hypothetical protein
MSVTRGQRQAFHLDGCHFLRKGDVDHPDGYPMPLLDAISCAKAMLIALMDIQCLYWMPSFCRRIYRDRSVVEVFVELASA